MFWQTNGFGRHSIKPTFPSSSPPTPATQMVSAMGLRVLNATDLIEIEEAFATVARDGGGALQLGVDPLFAHVREVIGMAPRHSVPTIYPWREFTAAGGLMSYGAVILDASRQVGVYTGKILSGEKAANLPVQRPTKLGFVINLKTAMALGLTIPPAVLSVGDEVID
jgi:putative ABC transport system substrate-binding protein